MSAANEAGVPLGPIESDPIEAYRGWRNLTEAKGEILTAALLGVDLGHYDRRIFAWMIHALDQPTLVTIVSLIERARMQGWREGFEAHRLAATSAPGAEDAQPVQGSEDYR